MPPTVFAAFSILSVCQVYRFVMHSCSLPSNSSFSSTDEPYGMSAMLLCSSSLPNRVKMHLPSIALCVLTAVSKEEQRLHLSDWSSHLPSHITFSTVLPMYGFPHAICRMLTALLYFNNNFLENTSALMLVIESQRCRLTPLFLHYLHLCFFHLDEILHSGIQTQEVMVICQWFLARGEINKTVFLD